MIVVREYQDGRGRSPFANWFNGLDATVAAKITMALQRMELGNLANAKSLRGGVFEYRLDTGPGYRIYFGKDGETLILLLGGGTKRRQQTDISRAKELWGEYRQRKEAEEA